MKLQKNSYSQISFIRIVSIDGVCISIKYFVNRRLDPRAVANVYQSSGLKRPVNDIERINKMLEHANLVVSAWDGEQLVGVARALTDFCFCCYLSDLAVAKEYQKKGIGKELVNRVQTEIGDETMLLLLSVPEAMQYYPHIGFEPVSNGWIIKRKH